MLDWLWASGSAEDALKKEKKDQTQAANSRTVQLSRLKGFHELAKDALNRACEADKNGDTERAVKLYITGLEAIREALAIPVQGSGLSSKADSVESIKQELRGWAQDAGERLNTLTAPRTGAPVQQSAPSVSRQTPTPRPASAATRSPAAAPPRSTAAQSRVVKPPAQSVQQHRAVQGRVYAAGGSAAGGGAASFSPSTVNARAGQRPSAPAAAAAGAPPKDDQKYRDAVLGEILETAGMVSWADIAGLETAKQALMEAVVLPSLRADIFQGLRAPVRGILLYGPPGNGKTMLGKALAHEAKATFFNISASSLTSKWVGDGEKLVRALFQVASEHQPAIIFIDEIDSILSARSSNENDAMRRLKTEFLVQFDGVAGGSARVIVVGATNRPADIDDAVRRRLVKRVYIPLPEDQGRAAVIQHLLQSQKSKLHPTDFNKVVKATAGYSASDLNALCKEAAMEPIRELGPNIASVRLSAIRAIQAGDFQKALTAIKPSTDRAMLKGYEDWTREFGTK